MAKIIGHVDLYELGRRLDARRPAHKGALDDISNIIQEGKKKRLAAAPAHTCNVVRNLSGRNLSAIRRPLKFVCKKT